ncbi:restriction endonuclease subunit S [Odoribacter splanchnicus]|uniref:restriction endonuclease subunit S n=1 Tax=Odoribacter splanchnicus TaxID=28118 RepID=UPI001C39177C|nr:restriction endonuclease subunit S [Odoribacter splanchnicus]MBV4399109.1 restriction endonuclease subunit S [Odoribacter splanchnicus]MBV4407415.1 restriction endonuclease subunit S [Odoribacter splanchnicus]
MRFPEFTEEWKKVRVSNLLDFYPTNSLSWEQLDYSNGQIKNLHYGLIHKGLPTMVDASSDLLPYIKEEIVPKSYTLFKEGDVSFADASEDTNDVAKAIEILNCNGQQIVSGLHTIHGRDNTDQTVIGYKGYAFASESFHKQIRRIAQGTKVFSVSVRNFDETYIGVPSKDEQAKIAKLLIAIDKRIATQNKIIEKLQSLIKGLNDSLYKQYGNAITTSFSDLGHSYSGLSGKSSEDFGSGKPFITYLNVYSNNVVNENEYQYVRINDGEKQNIVQCGDVLFTLSSETPEEVGVGSVYLGIDEVFLNSFCFGFHIDNKELAYPPYFSYYVSSTPFRKFIYPFAQGSTRFNLCKADFEKASIKLPSLNNQKHIYAILNSITGKIETEKNLLEYYTTQKQYLLRQMFI